MNVNTSWMLDAINTNKTLESLKKEHQHDWTRKAHIFNSRREARSVQRSMKYLIGLESIPVSVSSKVNKQMASCMIKSTEDSIEKLRMDARDFVKAQDGSLGLSINTPGGNVESISQIMLEQAASNAVMDSAISVNVLKSRPSGITRIPIRQDYVIRSFGSVGASLIKEDFDEQTPPKGRTQKAHNNIMKLNKGKKW